MPVERELKFVLRGGTELAADIRQAAAIENGPSSGSVCAVAINQGYLQKGSRVRQLNPVHLVGIPSMVANTYYRYTYKQKLKTQPGDLELEFDIPKCDFDLAWLEADRKLFKIRINLPMGNFVFEIDHFYKSEQDFEGGQMPYLVMAEVELPFQGGEFAYEIVDVALHPIIEKYLLLAVPEEDNRFSNRKLGDRDYVTKILNEVTNGASS